MIKFNLIMNKHIRYIFLLRTGIIGVLLTLVSLPSLQGESSYEYEELRRFPAKEAKQAVAVDKKFFYAISNHAIGKYDKATGERVAGWECPEGEPLIHLNSGVVLKGKLYCAHSNYSGVPMTGSIEIWDTRTMKHIGSHSFGIYSGSTTWVDFYEGHWYVAFAHYGNRAAEPNRDSSWTNLVKFDKDWNRKEGWVFPAAILEKFGVYSSSGGIFDKEGLLYVTGHDPKEIWVLKIPQAGSILEFIDTIPVNNPGQGIAWDPSEQDIFYAIYKSNREIIVSRLEKK